MSEQGEERDELASFREQWRAELRLRKLQPATLSPLDMYTKAIQLESDGDLEAAVTLYRKAFRLEPNIDRLFENEQLQKKPKKGSIEVVEQEEPEDLAALEVVDALKNLTVSNVGPVGAIVSGDLAAILAEFPLPLKFFPADEFAAEPEVNRLPMELWFGILGFLDEAAIERFARVCRLARYLTADPVIWKERVMRAYVAHQLHGVSFDSLVRHYAWDFRSFFVNVPRVRMDGVYIAVCHYVRNGLSDNRWVSVNHLITYHRYLRFLPDGRVISLLANEDVAPQQIVPQLKPTLRMKGLYIGRWHLQGDSVHIKNLTDPDVHSDPSTGPTHTFVEGSSSGTTVDSSSHTKATHHRPSTHHQPPSKPTHAPSPSGSSMLFRMKLSLRSRPVVGRWNKLEMLEYVSVSPSDGDETNLLSTWKGDGNGSGNQKEKPFWFSKVARWA